MEAVLGKIHSEIETIGAGVQDANVTEMLPQPPPDAPMPPASGEALRSRKWWSWILGVGIVSMVAMSLWLLVSWLVIRSYRSQGSRFTALLIQMKQVGLGLSSFKEDLGDYPNEATALKLQADHPSNTIPMGTLTANDFFRQLLVAEVVDNERIFFGGPGKRPDGRIDGAHALEKGECSFAYLKGASDSYYCPIVVYPLVKGKLQFDYTLCKTWGDKAAVLFTDGSVLRIPVDSSGRGQFNGKDFFDPSQPFWNGRMPDVKWPE